jgi:hypothetical protein
MGEAFEIIAMLAGSYALIRFGAFILANTDDALMGELPEEEKAAANRKIGGRIASVGDCSRNTCGTQRTGSSSSHGGNGTVI